MIWALLCLSHSEVADQRPSPNCCRLYLQSQHDDFRGTKREEEGVVIGFRIQIPLNSIWELSKFNCAGLNVSEMQGKQSQRAPGGQGT